MSLHFSPVDGVVFALVFGLTLGAVAYGRKRLKKNHIEEDKFELLLMGRKITLPLFIMSLVVSWYGEISGATAFTYTHGMFSFVAQSLVWYVAYLIFALVLVSKMPKNNAATFPELVGNHLGPRAHRVTAVLTILSMLPIASILAIGIFLHFLTGWPFFLSAAVGLLCIFSYSLSGGLRSVVFADVVQFVALMSAVICVAIFAMIHYGAPTEMATHLPATHLQLMGGKGFSEAFIWGFIALSTLVDPLFYQRALAAKDEKQARRGILGATLIWFVFDCAAIIGALYARAYLPNLDPNESYLRFAMEILPRGLRGFLLAGVFAGIVSSLDSHLFSTASMFSFDLLKKEKFNKRRLQWSMIGVGLLALLITPFFDNIATVWKTLGSISSACLLFPWLLMMIFPRHKSEFRFLMSVGTGLVLMIVGAILGQVSAVEVDAFYFGLGGSMLGYGLSFVFSRSTNFNF